MNRLSRRTQIKLYFLICSGSRCRIEPNNTLKKIRYLWRDWDVFIFIYNLGILKWSLSLTEFGMRCLAERVGQPSVVSEMRSNPFPRTPPTASTCLPTAHTDARSTRFMSSLTTMTLHLGQHTSRHLLRSSIWRSCVMFNVYHGRKYVPTRSSVTAQAVHRSKSPVPLSEVLEVTSPPLGDKMRISKMNKGAVVRAVRRHPSPQPASLESLEAAWSERGHPEGLPSPERSNGEPEEAGSGQEGHGGGPPRSRKKGFRPPDVRTIFFPGERDPRVKKESGEGHSFGPGGEGTWCDVCCHYIFQHGLTCAGESQNTRAPLKEQLNSWPMYDPVWRFDLTEYRWGFNLNEQIQPQLICFWPQPVQKRSHHILGYFQGF